MKSALRGALSFGLGAVILAWAESRFMQSPSAVPVSLLFAYAASGMVPAALLLWRPSEVSYPILPLVIFGVGFFVGNFLVMFVHVSLQGGGQPSYLYAALGCGFAYGLAGAVSGSSLSLGHAFAGALAFGLAGAIGGPLSFYLVIHHGVRGDWMAFFPPYLLGGALYGPAIARYRG